MRQYLKMADMFGGAITISSGSRERLISYGGEVVATSPSPSVAKYAAHAINSHDELVQMNQELLAALEQCAKELTWIIDQHNKQSMEDGSWLYDHQTPWEAMQLVGKAKGGAA